MSTQINVLFPAVDHWRLFVGADLARHSDFINDVGREERAQLSTGLFKLSSVRFIIDDQNESPDIGGRVVVNALLVLDGQILLISQCLNRANRVLIIHTDHNSDANRLLSQLVHLETIAIKVALFQLGVPRGF